HAVPVHACPPVVEIRTLLCKTRAVLLRLRRLNQARDCREEGYRLDRLRELGVLASRQRALCRGTRAQQHIAVVTRQPAIGKEYVRMPVLERRERLRRTGDRAGFGAGIAQHLQQDLARRLVVLHHEDPYAREERRLERASEGSALGRELLAQPAGPLRASRRRCFQLGEHRGEQAILGVARLLGGLAQAPLALSRGARRLLGALALVDVQAHAEVPGKA